MLRAKYGKPVPREYETLQAVHEAWLPREHALHRPRHGGRQLTALLAAAVFFLVPALMWVFGGRPAETENHKLADVGTGWGAFTSLPAWASDHLVFRAPAIDAARSISRGVFGERAPFGQGLGRNAGPLPGSVPDLSPGIEQGTSRLPGGDGSQRVIIGTDGWLYYAFDSKAKCSPVQPFTETVAQLNELRDAVRDSGRRFVFVIAPDKTTMVPEHLPADYRNKECSQAAADRVWRLATQQAGALDLRRRLNATERRLGHPLYFVKGTHWNHRAAIILTRTLAEALRPGITDTWRIKPARRFTSSADLPPMLGREGPRTGTIYEVRPNGRTDRTVDNIESINEPVRHRASPLDSTVNASTVMLGDSFTLASARYLPAGFSDLTMLSYTSIGSEGSPVIKQMVGSDIVVVEIVERAFTNGTAPVLRQDFIDRARKTLAAHPR